MTTRFKKKMRSGRFVPGKYSYDQDQLYHDSENQDGAFYNETLYETANRLKDWNTFETPMLEQIGNEIKIRIKITKQEIFRIGELLHLAKDICYQQGLEYKQWISDNFDFSYETAHNFVSVYLQCLCYRDIAMQVPASILYKISQRGFDKELRKHLFEGGHLEEMTGQRLKGIVDKYKEGGLEAVKDDLKEIREGNMIISQLRYTFDMCENALRTLDDLRIKIETRGGTKEGVVDYTILLKEQHPLAAEINEALHVRLLLSMTELEGTINDAKQKVTEFIDLNKDKM